MIQKKDDKKKAYEPFKLKTAMLNLKIELMIRSWGIDTMCRKTAV